MKTIVLFSVMLHKFRTTSLLFSSSLFATNIICVLLVLTLLSNYFGYATVSSVQLIAIFLLLGVVLLNLPLRLTLQNLSKTNPFFLKLVIGILLCLFGFLLLLVSKITLLWISSVPVILSGIDLSLQGINRRRDELSLLAKASFVYAIVFLLLQTIPSLWYFSQQTSLLISQMIGALTHTSFLLGPTTSGLGILLLSVVFLMSSFFYLFKKTHASLRWFCVCLIGLGITWFFYLLLLSLISYPSTDALNLHPLFFFLCLLPLFGFLVRAPFKDREVSVSQKIQLSRYLKNGAVWAIVFLFLSTSILTLFFMGGPSTPEEQRVVFYADHMVGTWDVPAYGKYGKDAVGMFGLWPIYLTTLGYETECLVENRTQFLNATQTTALNITRYLNLTDYTTVREITTLQESTLSHASVFVVSNLNVSFSDQEQTIIWEYVKQGGSLLVIGDHTNVGGMQIPLNELLAPVGIRYRFDAALPFDEKFKWFTCTQLLHHPVTFSLTNPDELQYGIGASLDLSLSSFPVIIGSSVLSDNGNRSNADIAYLGDYEYNKGEQLGDVILVAGAYYGQGKVLVFGDTSSFQNAALPFSYPFIQSSFAWLTSEHTGTATAFQIGISFVLLLAAVLVLWFPRNSLIAFAWFPVLLCLALLLSTSLNPLLIRTAQNTADNIVYIDSSHGERFSRESFTDDAVNGLMVNLERNNLLPVLLRDFSNQELLKSGLIIFNAPTRAFTADEVTMLQSYMTQGGVILLATGYEDKDASLPLLQMFSVDIESIPLGPVPYVEENLTLYQNEPRFVDSWPVSFQSNQATSYYNFTWGEHTFDLVVFVKHGAGGLLVIGDSQYLLDRNLESIYDYWPGNILFIKYLLDELPIRGEK